MKHWVESQLLQFKFKAACEKIAKITNKVRLLKEVRNTKLHILDKFFDKEKRLMEEYYKEKAKKIKSHKKMYLQLQKMNPEMKQLVLQLYYEGLVSSENLKNAIVITATKQKREDKLFKDDEHRNLIVLERNIATSKQFLFKGLKDGPAVGGANEVDLYALDGNAKQAKIEKMRLEKEEAERLAKMPVKKQKTAAQAAKKNQ